MGRTLIPPLVARNVLRPRAVAGVREHYEARSKQIDLELAELAQRSDGLSRWRGLTALPAGLLVVVGWVSGLPSWAWGIAAALGAVFVGLVVKHGFVTAAELELGQRKLLVQAGQKRMLGEDEPEDPHRKRVDDPFGARFLVAEHPYAGDLDIFGQGSLFAAMSRAETAVGEETLARWLARRATSKEIAERQEAARELARKPRLLEDLAVLARRSQSRGRAEDPLALWGEAPSEMPVAGVTRPEAQKRKLYVVLGAVCVPLTILAFNLRGVLAGLHHWASLAYVAPLLGQLVALGATLGPVRRMIDFVTSREAPFGRFRGVFELVEAMEVEAPMLQRAKAALLGQGGEPRASEEIARLERVVGFADLRHNSLVHFFVNLGLLYDIWVALFLERWRVRSGKRARAWLVALGELEALASLASYAAEHPDYAWPELVEGEALLEADAVGHPLLAPDKRVTNDVRLGTTDRALLVTGSNMSGKSTYLRSMGLAAVMAQAGSVVCAKRARLSRLDVWTSMRIQDSLSKGASHFYAELLRLRAVVDGSRRAPVLFLLDEILHGTNSRERTIGARGVVHHLVEGGAIGAVSTHDLALVQLAEESGGKVRIVHFSDRIEGSEMVFDYTLKQGVVRSTNAIRLMKLVGIDVAYDDGAPSSERPPEG